MQRERVDILIAGGGVAGLAAACAFGSAGFSVICVDPTPPVTDEGAAGADLRTTAILQPGRAALDEAGVWDRLTDHAMPLEVMQVVEDGAGGGRRARAFRAGDLGPGPFGWNLPNWLLRREMMARLETLQNVDFRAGTGFARLLARESGARVTLSDGHSVDARLLIAADGRDSPVREALGIGARTLRYGQKALAFAVTHPEPHHNISTEIHRSGGPFTLVPLPDRDGQHRSSVVWMEHGPRAQALASLSRTDFEAEATARSTGLLGPLTLASRRQVWPIISRLADRMAGPHTALMAEAAHVVPPIGAQGLNMSLADMTCLLDLARRFPESLGGAHMLGVYERRRLPEVRLRVLGVDALNRASQMGAAPASQLRGLGLSALHDIAPIRRTLMKLGLGAQETRSA